MKQKDSVALMMLNRPDFVIFWLGCAKVGISCSLINTNSTGKTLIHACNVSLEHITTKKLVIVDDELRGHISNDINDIESLGINVLYWKDIYSDIKTFPTNRVNKQLRNEIRERDPLMFVFTSGTTGLPKASKISHSRFIVAGLPYAILAELNDKDRVYNCLPLYHSASGMLGVGAVIRSGACMILRKKFSARNFASDCVKYKCTSIQYIGELCRYLLTAPENLIDESKLQIKTAFGNGIRPDVWRKFQERYHIQHIVEFYASTEGNLGLFNCCDRVGALGYVPRIADFIYPISIIKTDENDKTIPYRNAEGHCVVCQTNEVGLLVASINNDRVDRRFDGYTDSEATKKKILRNVFTNGDVFFNTGDLLYRDSLGFFYWSDRTGDTYRWYSISFLDSPNFIYLINSIIGKGKMSHVVRFQRFSV